MSDRKTPYWMKNNEGAYGESGAKGDRGERLATKMLRQWGYEVSPQPDDEVFQRAGIDLFFRQCPDCRWFGVDVKNNLRLGGDIGIEWRKLYRTKSDFWLHVNEDHPEDFIIYDVQSMVEYLKRQEHLTSLVWVSREVALNF